MAYGNSYEERVAAIPGQLPRKPQPSTADILAQGKVLLAGGAEGREPYPRQFGPGGVVSESPAYTGVKGAPQQFYASAADLTQSDVIRNTPANPYATRTAVQNARLADGQRLNLEYGDDVSGNTNIVATSSRPGGKANIFSGSSTPLTPAQEAIEAARVAEGQRVAEMNHRFLATRGEGGREAGAPALDIIGGEGEGWAGLLAAGIKGKQQRQAAEFGEKVAGRKALEARSAAEQAIQMRGQDLSAQAARQGREKSPEELAQIKAQTELYGVQKVGEELKQREAQKVATLEESLKTLPTGDPRRAAVMQELQNIRRQAEESKIRQIQAQALARVQAEQAAYGGGV